MKEIRVASWKLPPREMSCHHFREISPSENNHVYNKFSFVFILGIHNLHANTKTLVQGVTGYLHANNNTLLHSTCSGDPWK